MIRKFWRHFIALLPLAFALSLAMGIWLAIVTGASALFEWVTS